MRLPVAQVRIAWRADNALVQPIDLMTPITFDLTADNPGDWAFHCHLLFHMHAGMFNVVTVRPLDGVAT